MGERKGDYAGGTRIKGAHEYGRRRPRAPGGAAAPTPQARRAWHNDGRTAGGRGL